MDRRGGKRKTSYSAADQVQSAEGERLKVGARRRAVAKGPMKRNL